jgi:acyl dehydratase
MTPRFMNYVENRTLDEIKLGDSATLVRTLSKDDISLFAVMSGDVNPTHGDEEYAQSDAFHKIIGHGMCSADSPVSVWVIPTDEELMMARHTLACARRP